jgi:ankyrin repeat protein
MTIFLALALFLFLNTCCAQIETKWVGGPMSLPEFHQHAHFNRLEKMEEMLNNGQDIHAHETEDGRTALLISARKCHISGVKLLLSRGADVEERDLMSRTPLIEAAANCNVEMLTILILAGAKVQSIDEFGHTPLMAAAHIGHLAGVQYLIENGADADVSSKSEPGKPARTASKWAREAGHKEVAEYLESFTYIPTKRPEFKPTPTKRLDEIDNDDNDMKEL